MKIMNKFLSFFGLCTLRKYRVETKERYILMDGLTRRIEEQKKEIANIKKDCTRRLYEFESLLSLYTEAQLNALFYELINKARNTKDLSHLVERWNKRLEDATLHPAR